MKWIMMLMCLVMFQSVCAEQTNILCSYQQKFDKEMQSLADQYRDSLGKMMTDFKQRGDLDNYLLVKNEGTRFSAEKNIPSLAETKKPLIEPVKQYYSAMERLLEHYIKALDELVKAEVKAGQIENAQLIKAERVRVSAMPNIREGTSSKTVQKSAESASTLQDFKLISVDSTSRKGTRLGLFKRGQSILLQYVRGSWILGVDNPKVWPERNPDDDSNLPTIYRSTLCKFDASTNEMTILTIVPGGTSKAPFSYTVNNDCDVWLLCNDAAIGNRISNNKGIVEYRLSIK